MSVQNKTNKSSKIGRACAIGAVIFAVIYNGVLAFLYAHGIPMTTSAVAATEILILGFAGLLILETGFSQTDIVPIAFLYLGIVIGVYMSFVNERFFADGARIFAIVGIFLMLGSRIETRYVDRCFFILTSLILGVLVIELSSTSLYVSLFKPAAYFAATRGIEMFSLNKTGLFANALGFEGRLSLNPFSQYRTASLFLEQVSLANYGGVLIVYLLTRWTPLSLKVKVTHAFALILILLTTSTRTSISLALIGLLGYWIYPRLPRFATLALVPALLLISLGLVLYFGSSGADDLVGRLSRTIDPLRSLSADGLLGFRAGLLPRFADSGYLYLIYATTIFGAIAFWIFVSLILEQKNIGEKRCAWAAAFYFFINLLISGTAVFSIKTAAPLWFLIGSLYGQHAKPRTPTGSSEI